MLGAIRQHLGGLLVRFPLMKVIKFSAVGLGATAVHAVMFVLLADLLGMDPVPATVLAFLVAFLFGYFVNHAWTFRLKGNHGRFMTRYGVTAVTGVVLNAGLMHLTTNVLDWNHHLGLAVVLTAVALFSLVTNFLWSFRD